jgi:rifampicin phosphotransferase
MGCSLAHPPASVISPPCGDQTELIMKDYILFLKDLPEGEEALSLVGGKAYNLARLLQAGFPVPPGFCLTAEAYRLFWEANRLSDLVGVPEAGEDKRTVREKGNSSIDLAFEARLREGYKNAVFPEDLTQAVRQAYEQLVESDPLVRLAVRSSGRMEDGTGASYAGQYETTLEVCGLEKLEDSLKEGWASLFSKRSTAYASRRDGGEKDTVLPLLVQQMVFPDFSGIAFSINPTNGAGEIVVEVVSGLGEGLVSGEQSPDYFRLDKKTLQILENRSAGPETESIAPEQLVEVGRLVMNAESFFGRPQDVEWAVREGKVTLLQSRPITALKHARELVSNGQVDMEFLLRRSEENGSEIWTDDNVGEVFPEAVTPLSWSILEPAGNHAFRSFLRRMGVRSYPAAGLFGRFYGRVYFNQSQFQKLMELFYPSRLRKKKAQTIGLLKAGLALVESGLRALFWLPALPILSKRTGARTISELDALPAVKDLSPGKMWEQIENLQQVEVRLMDIHLSVTIFASLLYSLMDKLVPVWSQGRVEAASLTAGLPGMKSAEMGQDLAALAEEAARYPVLVECLKNASPGEASTCLQEKSGIQAFLEAFRFFMKKHGHASSQEFELAHPRWREQPETVLGMLKVQLQAQKDGADFSTWKNQQEIRLQAEKEMFRCLGHGPKRAAFRMLLSLVQVYSVERENMKYAFVKAHGFLREAVLRLAGYLVMSGLLFDREDIFFLTREETASLLEARISPGEAAARAKSRRLEFREQAERRENAPRLLEQKPDGSFHTLSLKEVISLPNIDGKEEILHGVAASAGLFTGRVRVINRPEDSASLQTGEILVTRSTNPAWSPLLLSAGALVTEIGGLLSHGAIVAREYGLPAVLNVKGITGLVKTGQIITVDGYRGVIHFSDRDGGE